VADSGPGTGTKLVVALAAVGIVLMFAVMLIFG
jgi:hypothetical protein